MSRVVTDGVPDAGGTKVPLTCGVTDVPGVPDEKDLSRRRERARTHTHTRSRIENIRDTGTSVTLSRRVLWSQRDIADHLGVGYTRVSMWSKRGMLPAPVACSLRASARGGRPRGPLFDADEVMTWWSTYDPNARRGAHWAEKRQREEADHGRTT